MQPQSSSSKFSSTLFLNASLTRLLRVPPKVYPAGSTCCKRPTSAAHMAEFPLSSVETVEWLAEPIVVSGKVQRGFGRGSRDLGTPTANLPGTLLNGVGAADRDGVYLGFGCVPKFGKTIVKMVANLGRNITYDDVSERVLESYLMSDIFDPEFYGEEMRLCIIGYMRPEWKFNSIEQLIEHINNDVAVAKKALDLPQAQTYADHPPLKE